MWMAPDNIYKAAARDTLLSPRVKAPKPASIKVKIAGLTKSKKQESQGFAVNVITPLELEVSSSSKGPGCPPNRKVESGPPRPKTDKTSSPPRDKGKEPSRGSNLIDSSPDSSPSTSDSEVLNMSPKFATKKPPEVEEKSDLFWTAFREKTKQYIQNAHKESTDGVYTNLLKSANGKIKDVTGLTLTGANNPGLMLLALSAVVNVKGVMARNEHGKFSRSTFDSIIAATKAYFRRRAKPDPWEDYIHPEFNAMKDFIKGARKAAEGPADNKYAPKREEIDAQVNAILLRSQGLDMITAERAFATHFPKAAKKLKPPAKVEPITSSKTIADAASLRAAALLTLGFYGIRRIQEVVELQWSDITSSESGFSVVIRKSKKGQYGRGHVFHVPTGRKLDVVLQRWRSFLTHQYGEDAGSPNATVFISVLGKNKGHALTAEAARRLINSALEDKRGGQPVSLRKGGACHTVTGAGSGTALETGGWASDVMIRQRYARQPSFNEARDRLNKIAADELARDQFNQLEALLRRGEDMREASFFRALEECSHLQKCEKVKQMICDQCSLRSPIWVTHAALARKAWATGRAKEIQIKKEEKREKKQKQLCTTSSHQIDGVVAHGPLTAPQKRATSSGNTSFQAGNAIKEKKLQKKLAKARAKGM